MADASKKRRHNAEQVRRAEREATAARRHAYRVLDVSLRRARAALETLQRGGRS